MHTFFQDFNFYGFVHRGGDEKKTENTLEAFQYSSNHLIFNARLQKLILKTL